MRFLTKGGHRWTISSFMPTKPKIVVSDIGHRYPSQGHADALAEESLIFAHGLIALRKIGPKNIDLWIEGYDGVSQEAKEETTVIPYYMKTEDLEKEPKTIQVKYDDAQNAAKQHKADFGFTDDAAW
jgi:hypothetical protein